MQDWRPQGPHRGVRQQRRAQQPLNDLCQLAARPASPTGVRLPASHHAIWNATLRPDTHSCPSVALPFSQLRKRLYQSQGQIA